MRYSKFKDKTLKNKWVKALRSGKYKQCRNTLEMDDYYCCLGVLEKITPKGTKAKIANGEFKYELIDGYDIIENQTSCDVRDECTKLNDEGRKSFKEIANWVDKNL